MKILIVTNHFYPEFFRVNDVAFDLAEKGNEVTVITCIPNYPQGRFFDGYGFTKKRKEKIKGVTVHRVPVIPRGDGSGSCLFLNYLSYLITASFTAFFLAIRKKYDCVFVHETSPVTVGIPAVIVRRIQQIPMYLWVLDLWPESLNAAGGVNNRYILSFFERIVKFLYNKSDKILISSKGFEVSILEKGDYKSKIIYFPNWGENIFSQQTVDLIPPLPDGFKIMFAGNIGEAQDFESIMQVALALKQYKELKWILIGDGRKKEWVDSFILANNLEDIVFTLGRYPIEMMPSFFKEADAMLVTLKDEFIFNLTVPAKLQAYMAASKPVLAMLNGEGAAIIKESDCGYAVNSGDIVSLVNVIKNKVMKERDSFREKGVKGNSYFNTFFRKDLCMNHLTEILQPK